MTETILYYIAIGFIIGIAFMVYVVRYEGKTTTIETAAVSVFWPFYILGIFQRKIALWILKIIK
jgi:hypothetical protein